MFPELREFCQWETFNATCPDNEVVVMESARYGRMQLGRCVTKSWGSMGCMKDVFHHVDSLCSGVQTCHFHVPDDYMKRLAVPCEKELTLYLDASYNCVPGTVHAEKRFLGISY